MALSERRVMLLKHSEADNGERQDNVSTVVERRLSEQNRFVSTTDSELTDLYLKRVNITASFYTTFYYIFYVSFQL